MKVKRIKTKNGPKWHFDWHKVPSGVAIDVTYISTGCQAKNGALRFNLARTSYLIPKSVIKEWAKL